MSTEGSQASTSTGHDASAADGRPKRKAALDRPDYWNMHHHNATPTKGWIDLIKDPKKHGRVIKPDNFPRVPGELLRRPWLDGETVNELPPTLFYGPTREPLVVRPENGGLASMGGKVPGPSLTVDDVSRLVGPEKMVDVIGELPILQPELTTRCQHPAVLTMATAQMGRLYSCAAIR